MDAHQQLVDFLEAKRNLEWTLRSLSGERYYLPPEDEPLFLRLYSTTKGSFSLAEKRTPVFRYFVAFDLNDPQTLDYARATQQVLQAFYSQNVELIICIATKHGLRLYAPSLYVTAQQALDIREQLVVHFELNFGPQHNWAKVIDHTPYTTHPALRLLYSPTLSKCPDCLRNFRRKKLITCPVGCHRGYLPQGERCYEPKGVLSAEGEFDDRAQEPLHWLQRTSIRHHGEPTPNFRLPRCCHPSPLETTSGAYQVHDSEDEREPDIPRQDARKLACLRNAVLCDMAEPWMHILAELLRSDPKYKGVLMRQVLRANGNPPYYLVQVRGPGAQYCFNKGSAHKRNCIYFQVTPYHLVQKCFNNSTKTRCSGLPCRHFHTNRLPVPLELRSALFGFGT